MIVSETIDELTRLSQKSTNVATLQARIEELTKALRGLDTLLDFSDDNVGQTWSFEDTSSIQEAFAEAYRALSVPLEQSRSGK